MPLVCGLRAGGWIFLASGERNVEAAGAAGGRAVGARLSLSAARALPCRISLQWIKGLREFYATQATARCHRPRSFAAFRPRQYALCRRLFTQTTPYSILLCFRNRNMRKSVPAFAWYSTFFALQSVFWHEFDVLCCRLFLARGVLISNLTYDFEYSMDRRGNLWI